MSEYASVEKPFLDKLGQIGWTIIHQGGTADSVPENPATSLRSSFSEYALRNVFFRSIQKINGGWLTDDQLAYCYDRIVLHGSEKLLEANESVYKMLRKGITLNGKNEKTGQENPTVKIIDFDEYAANDFTAVSQFRVDTPNTSYKFIIPDIVCFVNGLPLVVIECKDEDKAEPLSEAFNQIRRYSNQRSAYSYYAANEGKEQLFYTNLFNVATYGTAAIFGTVSADFDYYYNWRDIFPEEYKVINVGKDSERQEVMIRGMFNKEILIDLLQNFTLYMDLKSGDRIKVLARYNQYRAVGKMIVRLRDGKTWQERSGVLWHTQGSGKSLTMVFLVKKMRTTFQLKGYKIFMVVDRIELEDQLDRNADLTGENTNEPIPSKEDLYELRDDDTPDLNMVMIHKFGENAKYTPEVLAQTGIVPHFEEFPVLNESEKVLILIDEAHRTQGGDMNHNLFTAFPNASRIGFTGTPLMKKADRMTTCSRFGQNDDRYIDTYKMNDSVRDHATVDIKYIGKKTNDTIKDHEKFEDAFEKLFKAKTEDERQAIMQRYGGMTAYLESRDRIEKNAADMMNHYVSEILPNGFKAIIVGSSKVAAVRYKIAIENEIRKHIAIEEAKLEDERNGAVLARLKIMKARAVISMPEQNAEEYIRAAWKEGDKKEVIEQFCKDFNTEDPSKADTGTAFLCVCDRLLTGFDAPVLQVMYLDKNLREQNLMQAIARVNRTKKDKTHGIVVDYFGVLRNLRAALGIYTDEEAKDAKEELDDFSEYFADIAKEIPELELIYNSLLQFFDTDLDLADVSEFFDQKLSQSEDQEFVEDVIEKMSVVSNRVKLDLRVTKYLNQLDLLFCEQTVQRTHWVRAKRVGYLMYRIAYHYKDDTMDLKHASQKVRWLIDTYLENQGIDTKVDEISILDDEFPRIKKMYRGKKSQASAMEFALRHQIKITLEQKDPGLCIKFNDRIDSVIKTYKDNWDLMTAELDKVREDLNKGRKKDTRFTSVQPAFYDVLKGYVPASEGDKAVDEKMAALITSDGVIWKLIIGKIVIHGFWEKADLVKELSDGIAFHLRMSGIPELKEHDVDITDAIMNLCRSNYTELLEAARAMA
jgi:type I restriction enzyme, R subunit